jgi:hypothetical protein
MSAHIVFNISNAYSPVGLSTNKRITSGSIALPQCNIVSNNCCLYLDVICAWEHAAIFDKISGNLVWFATVICGLKEEKQDTSHIFLPRKRVNEVDNLTPLSIIVILTSSNLSQKSALLCQLTCWCYTVYK